MGASAPALSTQALRTSPRYDLVLYDRLEGHEREALAELTAQPAFYGILRRRAALPGDAQAQLRYLLKHVSQFAAESTGRGCALANAAVELAERKHPARKVVEAHKRRQCERLIALCREAGYAKPEQLADELFLLVEGARSSLQSVGPEGPGARLFALVERLLDAAPLRKGSGKKLKTA